MKDEEDQMLYLMRHPNGYYRIVGEDDNWTVAHEMAGDVVRLFTAAPEMLAALKKWMERYSRDTDRLAFYSDAIAMTQAAINKAEGRG